MSSTDFSTAIAILFGECVVTIGSRIDVQSVTSLCSFRVVSISGSIDRKSGLTSRPDNFAGETTRTVWVEILRGSEDR